MKIGGLRRVEIDRRREMVTILELMLSSSEVSLLAIIGGAMNGL